VLHSELGIALRGRKTLVSQHFLNGAQIGALFKQMRSESMAQRVGVNVR